jgi:hypothetical protein
MAAGMGRDEAGQPTSLIGAVIDLLIKIQVEHQTTVTRSWRAFENLAGEPAERPRSSCSKGSALQEWRHGIERRLRRSMTKR